MTEVKFEIPDELFMAGSSEFLSGSMPVSFDLGADRYDFAEPVSWSASISNAGDDTLVVLGHVSGKGRTNCARCLEDTYVQLDGEIEGTVFLTEPSEKQLEGFEEDEYIVLDREPKVLDLEPLIIAGLIVEASSVPLCKDDCAGLCPTCGQNLNEGLCACAVEEDDDPFDANPFAVLKNLDL